MPFMKGRGRFKKRKQVKPSKNIVKYVNRTVKKKMDEEVEDKHLVGNSGTITLTNVTPATATYLGGWANGTAWGQRVGQRIKIKYIKVRINMAYSGTVGTVDSNLARVLLVTDPQSNGINLVLQNDNSGLFQATNFVAGDYPVSMLNPVTTQIHGADRGSGKFYHVLHDRTHELHPFATDNSTAGTSASIAYDKLIVLQHRYPKGLYVTFGGANAGNITDVLDNAHFLVIASNLTVAGHGTIAYRIKYDICYQDA